MSLHHLFMLCLFPIVIPLVSYLIGMFIGLAVYSNKYFNEDKKKGRH